MTRRRIDIEAARIDVHDISDYLTRIRPLIVDQPQVAPSETGGKHAKVSGSPAPWNVPAAHWITDVHAGARDLETRLLVPALDVYRYRPGSDRHTLKALDQVVVLAEFVEGRDPDNDLPGEAFRRLAGWARAGRRLLDEVRHGEEPWSRAPGGLRCPECGQSLWLQPGWRAQRAAPVYCRRCRGEDGHLLSWPADAWIAVLQQQS